jgi:uncharacterized protein
MRFGAQPSLPTALASVSPKPADEATARLAPVTSAGPGPLSRLMLLASALLPMTALPGTAMAQTPPPATRVAGDADIDETASPFVDKATDVPMLNQQMKQAVVDLSRQPLLSPSARQQVEALLTGFNQTQDGQMALVVIPNTHRKELNSLATEVLNQIGIGQAGENNGLLLMLNAEALRTGQDKADIHLSWGDGLNGKMSAEKALEILKTHAFPHLRNKDYDRAVTETVQAVTQLIKPGVQPATAQSKEMTKEQLLIGGLVVMGLLFGLALAFDLSVYRGREFPATFLYLHLFELFFRIALIMASSGRSGGSSGGGGGGFGGGGSSGRGAGR